MFQAVVRSVQRQGDKLYAFGVEILDDRTTPPTRVTLETFVAKNKGDLAKDVRRALETLKESDEEAALAQELVGTKIGEL